MNCFVLTNRQRSAKTKEKNLQSFLDVAKTKYVESSYEVEGPNYWLVMTLLLWSKENWNQNKIKLLERLLILTQVNCLLYCYIILCYIIMAYYLWYWPKYLRKNNNNDDISHLRTVAFCLLCWKTIQNLILSTFFWYMTSYIFSK